MKGRLQWDSSNLLSFLLQAAMTLAAKSDVRRIKLDSPQDVPVLSKVENLHEARRLSNKVLFTESTWSEHTGCPTKNYTLFATAL